MNQAKRILIIDDDEKIRTSLQDILEQQGYVLNVAGNGNEGLRQCESVRPDLILTDIIMPDMEGIELIMALRKRLKKIPIIAMSGDIVGQKFLRAAQLLGAVDTLLKPFSARDLIEKINKAFGLGQSDG